MYATILFEHPVLVMSSVSYSLLGESNWYQFKQYLISDYFVTPLMNVFILAMHIAFLASEKAKKIKHRKCI